ncbi:MAG: serine hydroxymethyltransferase [Candidatus Micrarchaeota archaeon]|nr:serine hydroxymethyltransferase [Candidatus Micrarchaeota archaeon]
MNNYYKHLASVDQEVYSYVKMELERQRNTIGLIASENYASLAVLEALATPLNNKYAEGYPNKRYYAGNKIIDSIESIAIDRVKKLFDAEHANVQPHAGATANMSVYLATLNLGDKILALELAHGGHLTHGSNVNFSGAAYKFVHYHLDKETGLIDFEEVRKLALEHKPKMILCGYSAYPRKIDFKRFREIADEVNAILFADIAHIAGLVAGKAHENPFPYADIVSSTTHKTLRGPRGAIILCKEKFAKAIDKAVFPGTQGGPFEHCIAAKAVCFKEALQPEFKEYTRQIVKNAQAMAEEFINLGYSLVTNGTDNHLLLVDLVKSKLKVFGKEAQEKLESVGIICNRNMVPYDTRSPFDPSGIRLGTPMITTRNMKESESRYIAELVDKTLKTESKTELERIHENVLDLSSKFPLYKDLVL